jgi:hypothetical protein
MGRRKINKTSHSSTLSQHFSVVCDRSDSTLGTSCSPEALRVVFNSWITRGGLVIGSTFTVWVPGRTRDSTARVISLTTPDAPLGARAAAVLGAEQELDGAIVSAVKASSAIAEAISVAGEHLKAKLGQRQLIILSDMRQHTPGQWNFERIAPESAAFVAWLMREKLLPNLGGVALAICGAHHQRGPNAGPFDGRLAEKITGVWSAAFKAMGMRASISWTDCTR